MASIIEQGYNSLAKFTVWLKLKINEPIKLSDVPFLIPLRWNHFRDNWFYIKKNLYGIKSDQQDVFNQQIKTLDELIVGQQNSTKNINLFDSSEVFLQYYFIFEAFPYDFIPLSPSEDDQFKKINKDISNYSRNQFIDIRSSFLKVLDTLNDLYKHTDDTYNAIYKRSTNNNPIAISSKEILTYMYLYSLNIKSLDMILANYFFVNKGSVDPFAVARFNAKNPDFNVGAYSSGYLVQMSDTDDLRTLAKRYLKDPDKWLDIAIANGLKPPYIDNYGEMVMLKSNGKENSFVIDLFDSNGNDNSKKLALYQPIWVSSNDFPTPSQRQIANIIVQKNSESILIDVTGDTLNDYLVDSGAYIKFFKLNTINTYFYILIPDSKPTNELKKETPWFLKSKPEEEKLTKVDLALSPSGDLVFNNVNDMSLSYGISNAIQAVKLKLDIEEGENFRHPGFGLVNVAGNQNRQQAINKLKSSIQNQILNDTRFGGLEKLDIKYIKNKDKGVAIGVDLIVKLANKDQTPIPISFNLNT
jgi:hypothetical protein